MKRLPIVLFLALLGGRLAAEVPVPSSPATGMGPCVDVPLYVGKNDLPLVTSQIVPRAGPEVGMNTLPLPSQARNSKGSPIAGSSSSSLGSSHLRAK